MEDAGYIETYSHKGEIAAMVYFACRDPYALRTPEFRDVAKGVALNVVASGPIVIDESDLDVRAHYREIKNRFGEQVTDDDEAVIDMRDTIKKSLCLLEQPYVQEPNKSVAEVIAELNTKLGVEVAIRKFERWDARAT